MHKLSPAATKNADCYRSMTRPVLNNMTNRSDYNSKQQSNITPNFSFLHFITGSVSEFKFCTPYEPSLKTRRNVRREELLVIVVNSSTIVSCMKSTARYWRPVLYNSFSQSFPLPLSPILLTHLRWVVCCFAALNCSQTELSCY